MLAAFVRFYVGAMAAGLTGFAAYVCGCDDARWLIYGGAVLSLGCFVIAVVATFAAITAHFRNRD